MNTFKKILNPKMLIFALLLTMVLFITACSSSNGPTVDPVGVIKSDTVAIGGAVNYVILAESGVSTTAGSVVTGNIGVSPSPASYITGFGLIMDSTGTYATSSLVTGKIYSADYTSPTPADLTTAIANMKTAYTDAAGRAANYTELYSGDLSGKTLTSGVYKFGTSVLINSNLTLDGSSTDVWIFQIAGNLTMASDMEIKLKGGAQVKNIIW
ncbi:MAG: ice-binding family protein, partial [Acholeplasmataceae bacterium]|nr:ice-binding family protein [Acholeplasmataceae bacterium]